MLPNFLIVGAAKSGTTSLYSALEQHPDVFMPSWKEPAYFVEDYPRRAKTLREYEALFDAFGGARAVGEASTAYLYDSSTAEHIRDVLGDVRILIMLRNPVDRAYSHWGWMAFRYGFEPLSFEEALAQEPARRADSSFASFSAEWHASFYYYERGLYHDRVERYFNVFGRDRVRVHIFDDFKNDPGTVCRDIFEFLDVDPSFAPRFTHHNPASAARSRVLQRMLTRPPRLLELGYEALPLRARRVVYEGARAVHMLNLKAQSRAAMSSDTRAALVHRYRPEVERLEQLIGRDLTAWKHS